MVDVRNASVVEAVKEHNDTVTTHFLFGMDELREATAGSYLQFIDEFIVEAGTEIEPHYHDSHEFYYVLDGSGTMRVGDDRQQVTPRDLVHVPRNVPHTLRAGADGIRCLAFAASFQAVGETHTPVTLSD